jgi:protein-L-isoaspartate(D-aspartate) O-methyltransferase
VLTAEIPARHDGLITVAAGGAMPDLDADDLDADDLDADLTALREGLLAQVRERGGATDPLVADALRAIPRHVFVPGIPVDEAYRDDAIVTKRDADGHPVSSSSQPTMMAIMLDQLGLAPGQRVLEIGAGTGYNAALLGYIVGADGTVVSIDIDDDLVAGARANTLEAGYPDVRVVCADGADGYAEAAPYDRIIATVGVWDLAPAWLAQLAPGGRIVVPLDLRGVHRSVALERASEQINDGHWASRSVVPCGFIRMRGALAGPEQTRVLDQSADLWVTVPAADAPIDAAALLQALDGPSVQHSTGVTVRTTEFADGVSLWLALHEPRWCVVGETDRAGAPRLPAAPLRFHDTGFSAGVLDGAGDGLAVLARPADSALTTIGYGPAGDRLATGLADRVRAWDAAGRPGTHALRVDAYPRSTPDSALPPGAVIDKRHTRLVLTWVR